MDILTRVRMLIWALVLSLWAVMVYQYLGEDEGPGLRQLQLPLDKGKPVITHPWSSGPPIPARLTQEPFKPLSPAASSLRYVKAPLPSQSPEAGRGFRIGQPNHQAPPRQDLNVPAGFVRRSSRHFDVYSEGYPASEDLLGMLEKLHGNLMLDLAPFSPWARAEKVTIFLFRNQDTYRRVTGRPAWSGGASLVPKRKVYVYESEELVGILAHELCHIYYDGFFLGGHSNPLWLSEGMATLVQVERGLAAPNWLRENLALLEKGKGYSIENLVSVRTTARARDEEVRLWYAQTYSTVRFLLRAQYRSNFYKFSSYLRQGKEPPEALYRAYGMPFVKLKALEYAWRYDLTSNSVTRLANAE
ncbi:MAG: hypothetical protein HY549_05680 [Elusimicrobia bacterium]|nr:hypothetical protein [Elusimicrobiota bacterium]